MTCIIKSIFFIFLCFTTWNTQTHAVSAGTINFGVTPIKYELDLQPGESITLPASIKNNGTSTVTMPITASDFQASGPGGVPSIVRRSELVFPDQELASWISFASPSVTLAPGEKGTIDFTITVPTNATPGGHYGAVLFKNDNSVGGAPGKITINVDYGIIILVDVAGDVIVDVEVGEPSIGGGNSSNSARWFQLRDNCQFGDFTPSRYDGKCFGSTEPMLFENNEKEGSGSEINNNTSNLASEPELFSEDFGVSFVFPIKNNGNTHVKPDGKVILKDENGNIIKAVGKEIIVNDRGLILGEEIVDYIPINDQGGNVLPKTNRIFESEWEGFPYKSYDDAGNQIIQYWSPGEYYTNRNKQNAGFLMPWQRVSEVLQQKNITADIEISYLDENGKPIEFTTAKEFKIEYIEQQVTLNPYVILGLLLLFTAGIFTYFGARWWFLVIKTRPCWNCDEKIKSHWSACPHCKVLQNKRKQKAFEETKTTTTIKQTRKATPAKTVRKTPTKKK